MRREVGGWVLVACCGVLLAAGCAKQAEIKKDEGIASVAQAPAAPRKEVVAPVAAQNQAGQSLTAQGSGIEQKPVVTETKPETEPQRVAKEESALQQGLASIYFGFDSPKLTDDDRVILAKNAELLKKFPVGKVRVEGNCDERGSDDYNLALGEKRAKEAVQYLVNLGVPTEQLSVISYGKEKPAVPGHDEAAWAKNRRDEFVIVH
jgi:peptidoglycan-associated lipoprotein